MSTLVGALWRNWKNRQYTKVLGWVSRSTVMDSQTRTYAIHHTNEKNVEIDLLLKVELVLLSFPLGRKSGLSFQATIPVAIGDRHYLDRRGSTRSERRVFYGLKDGDLYHLLRRWVPWLDQSDRMPEYETAASEYLPFSETSSKHHTRQ